MFWRALLGLLGPGKVAPMSIAGPVPRRFEVIRLFVNLFFAPSAITTQTYALSLLEKRVAIDRLNFTGIAPQWGPKTTERADG